jgi:hypothetical protein
VAKRMLDEFAACLEQEISGANAADAAEPVPENTAADAATGGTAPPTANSRGTSDGAGDTAAVAGATVEGAIVAGSSPTEAAAAAPTTPMQQPAIQEIPRRETPAQPKPFHPDATAQEELPKRLPPALAGLGILLLLFWLLRRKR